MVNALDQTSWKDSLSIIYDEIRQEDNMVSSAKAQLYITNQMRPIVQGITSVADLAKLKVMQ